MTRRDPDDWAPKGWAGVGDPRQGGNYTRPTIYAHPVRFEVLHGHLLVGVYDTHIEAERALRVAFFGPQPAATVLTLIEKPSPELEDAQARKGKVSSSG